MLLEPVTPPGLVQWIRKQQPAGTLQRDNRQSKGQGKTEKRQPKVKERQRKGSRKVPKKGSQGKAAEKGASRNRPEKRQPKHKRKAEKRQPEKGQSGTGQRKRQPKLKERQRKRQPKKGREKGQPKQGKPKQGKPKQGRERAEKRGRPKPWHGQVLQVALELQPRLLQRRDSGLLLKPEAIRAIHVQSRRFNHNPR